MFRLARVALPVPGRHPGRVWTPTRRYTSPVTLYGYARVSSADQDLSIQEAALRAAGCQVVRAEKRSGSDRERRAELRGMPARRALARRVLGLSARLKGTSRNSPAVS